MTPIQTVALSKTVSAAAKRAASAGIEPGRHEGTVTVRVDYCLKVGEDYEQQIVAKADPWALLAVALSKLNGVTVDSLTREALEAGADVADVKARAKAAIGALKSPTTTRCNGKTTGTVSAVIVSGVSNNEAA